MNDVIQEILTDVRNMEDESVIEAGLRRLASKDATTVTLEEMMRDCRGYREEINELTKKLLAARDSLYRIRDNRNNRNWRKPEMIQEAEQGLSNSIPPSPRVIRMIECPVCKYDVPSPGCRDPKWCNNNIDDADVR